MSSPLISVIIPSYNHALYLSECINSVLNQSYKNLELIIVDDGSKDSSLEILKKVTDVRMQVYTQKNAGADHAINRGLSLSKGDYIGILNSDDVYDLKRLEKALNYFSLHPETDLLASWIEVIDSKSKSIGIKRAWKNMSPWPLLSIDEKSYPSLKSEYFRLNIIGSNFVATTSNVIFRRKVYESVGGMRPLRYAHDWDFLLRVCKSHRCELLEEPLLQYRIHSSNTISTNRPEMMLEILWIWATHLPFFENVFIFSQTNSDVRAKNIKLFQELINPQGLDLILSSLRGMPDAVLETLLQTPSLKLPYQDNIRAKTPTKREPRYARIRKVFRNIFGR